MLPSVRISLLSISLLFVITAVSAQSLLPEKPGDRQRFTAIVEMKNAYLSGICIMVRDSDLMKCSVFNEFGVSAIDFSYSPKKDKVKLHSVVGRMDKWYVRYVLKRDLRRLINNLRNGIPSYINDRQHIKYSFKPLILEDNATGE